MKFVSKPKVIEAVWFNENAPHWPPNVTHKDGKYTVYNKLHNSYIELKHGDYVRVDDLNDTYPIDRRYMEENYEVVQ